MCCIILLLQDLALKKEQPSVLLQEEKNRMDTRGILYKCQHCSYLDLVMSQICCCEHKSKTINSDNKHDMCLRTFLSPYAVSEGQSRSTYCLGHRWLCSWLWRTGILGSQFAANRKHNTAEQCYGWKQVKMISLVSSQTLDFSCMLFAKMKNKNRCKYRLCDEKIFGWISSLSCTSLEENICDCAQQEGKWFSFLTSKGC